MRALLVVNPKATATNRRTREVLARALATEVKIDIVETGYRGHAAALSLRAARDGVDLVVALGGDGTINEVVNGLLTDHPHAEPPALAIVPVGSTNVFSRALGQPQDPLEATADIIEALRRAARGEPLGQPIGLGRAGSRWFTFTAGLGLDAEVVHRMERRRRAGRSISHLRYVHAAVSQFYLHTDRRQPALTLGIPGQDPVPGLFLAIVANTSPWTYLGDRPLRPSPEASFDSGLDLFSMRTLGSLTTLRHLTQMLRKAPRLRGRHLYRLHDLTGFTLSADRPLGFQVDGDYLGERERVSFVAVPSALRVVI
ncbi:MAG: diacylglycerol kinase family lipid kinase [Actinobacteria bacterium]|nr:diacylglycerol kinase family lipid kinase [Actinomycetota bacterium]MBI3686636.1 diacylglycerol kinase family lipid kinase [Actinomycetota bacterium]